MLKTLETIDVEPILSAYLELDPKIQWKEMGHKGRQSGLQYKINEDPWSSAVGKSRGEELTYDNLNPFFAGTIFESIIEKFNLKRTRFMWCGPYACYSLHKDETPRIHIPLITNRSCLFVFPPNKMFHMPLGMVYLVDTRNVHTFMNCSDQHRLHLVGVVENF